MSVLPWDLTVQYVRSMGGSVHVSLVLKDATAVGANQASTILRSADVHVSTFRSAFARVQSWLIKKKTVR